MDKNEENSRSFLARFLIYQKERFPVLAHGIMILAFTFSAVSYSRICRGQTGFIDGFDFAIGVFATITLFFLVRIFDEFKDKEDDAKYRSYLPVPRGLISLKELQITGWVVIILQLLVLAVFQGAMLYLYLVVLAYLLLMRVEFFVPTWLKKRQLAYILSHMLIIPLVDMYASGLDWLLDGAEPHWGLVWFFAVSYVNGLVLEFGRKMKAPGFEEVGVVSYTGLYGSRGGPIIWIVLLLFTMLLAMGASVYTNYGWMAHLVFALFFVLCSLPGWMFLIKPTVKKAKLMEYASVIWTALMYLALGGIPMLTNLLF